MDDDLPLQNTVDHPSVLQSWIRRTMDASGPSMIVNLISFIISISLFISMLVIGILYRDPRYCPIEPRISNFLIVYASFGSGWIIASILFGLIVSTCLKDHRSSIDTVVVIVPQTTRVFGSFFSFIWLILGSVWTFQIRSRLTHEYDQINHFYTYNYCHPVLYKFTFSFLIVNYVLIAIYCCQWCFR
ncbi:hypothetical protein I4U23_006084 [Adineta vaga]|nr:hypothetical protein I4U23_006084 [Adineta vaga]